MKLLEKILLAVDINTTYSAQIEVAAKLANSYNSQVIISYVIPKEVLHPEIIDIVHNAVDTKLNEIKDLLEKDGVTVAHCIIENGKPSEKLLQLATTHGVNLILAGSGKGQSNNFKLGITAEKLIQLSDIPVWIVKNSEEVQFKRILCPVDFSEASQRALKNAILLTKNFNSQLTILNAYKPFTNLSPRIQVDMEAENSKLLRNQKQTMNSFLEDFDLSDVNFEISIEPGIIHEVILEKIKLDNSDLLVMGTNGRSVINRFMMGSITERVVREVPCPFITTKAQDIFQLRFDNELKEIEVHLENAQRLIDKGFLEEAIQQYQICLQINDMHIPSMYRLAGIYQKMGQKSKADYYENMAKEVLNKLWDKQIEYEIRNHYKSLK
ncbi:universal stress protein [Carboxylicivirga taeanensis]|uniref:universal stress protein n=1 Tax=Carboxylicivirga taeanensis TaxID=1416875 RepID=UPI003F6E268D